MNIKLFFLIVFIPFFSVFNNLEVFGQRFAYVDLEYILNKVPEYKKAQAALDALSKEWQKEVEEKNSKVNALYEKFQAESMLMTDAMKSERKLRIKKEEKAAQAFQNKIFGPGGLLFLKRQELIIPITDELFKSIEKVAKENKYQMVLDKSSGLVMIYTDPLYDLTEKVLIELGLSEEKETEESDQF